jgi:hypothetical protein
MVVRLKMETWVTVKDGARRGDGGKGGQVVGEEV